MKTKIKVADFFKEWTDTRPNLKVEFHDARIEAMAFAEAYHNAETKANGVQVSEETAILPHVNGSASKGQIITQLLDKLHEEAKGKEIKEYNNMMACSYGVVTIDIKIE
jgi:NAD-dependent SIR2 family protein deacetylase